MYREGDEPVPGYRLVQFLGRGQFGEVWRAESPGGTQAALKLIDISRASGLKELRGIELLKKIRHAHLTPITAMWLLDRDGRVLTDDLFATLASTAKPASDARSTMIPDAPALDESVRPSYLIVAMVLADESLEDVLKDCVDHGEEGIPRQRLMRYMTEAAKAIDHLNSPIHDLGSGPTAIQHCDIKPANIMLAGDSVMICDFGLARNFSGLQNAVAATSLVGSPAYMPPECIERKPSRSTDQYSLAITYCELSTGRLPFHSEEYVAVLDAHRSGDLDLSALSPQERTVIRKATAISPEDRYASTQEMVSALSDAALGKSSSGRKSGGTLVLLCAVIVIAVGAAGWKLYSDNRENGGTHPPTVEDVSIRFQVAPPDATVRLNDQDLHTDDQGWVETKVVPGKSLQLVVEHPNYESAEASYSVDQLKEGVAVKLQRSLQWLSKEADRALASNSLDQAIEHYQQLVRRNPATYAVIPAARWTLDKHTKAVRCLESSGTAVYSGGDDGKVYRFDFASGEPENKLVHEHPQMVELIVRSGEMTASADVFGQLVLTTPNVTKTLHDTDIVSLALSADQKWLAAGDFSGTLRCWSLDNLEKGPTEIETAHEESIRSLAFVGSENRFASGGADDRLKLWAAGSTLTQMDPVTLELHIEGDITQIVCSDASMVVFGGEQEDRRNAQSWFVLHSWKGQGSPVLLPGGHSDAINCLEISGDGRWIASGSTDGVVGIWDTSAAAPKQMPLPAHKAAVKDVLLIPDHDLLVSCGDDKQVCLWDLEDPRAIAWKLPGHGGRVFAVAATGDQRWLITGCEDGNIRVWDLQRLLMIWRACRLENVLAVPQDGGAPIFRS